MKLTFNSPLEVIGWLFLNQDKSILDVAVHANNLISFDKDTKVWNLFPYPCYFEQFNYPLTIEPTKELLFSTIKEPIQ
jgi:hypothetical protein